jgi:hypothetical protein
LDIFNSSSLPFFSVKVVLICSEALGLVKAGFTSGKLKVQFFSKRVRFAHTIILPFRLQQQQGAKYANISIHNTIRLHCVRALNSTFIKFEAWTQRGVEEVRSVFYKKLNMFCSTFVVTILLIVACLVMY